MEEKKRTIEDYRSDTIIAFSDKAIDQIKELKKEVEGISDFDEMKVKKLRELRVKCHEMMQTVEYVRDQINGIGKIPMPRHGVVISKPC